MKNYNHYLITLETACTKPVKHMLKFTHILHIYFSEYFFYFEIFNK